MRVMQYTRQRTNHILRLTFPDTAFPFADLNELDFKIGNLAQRRIYRADCNMKCLHWRDPFIAEHSFFDKCVRVFDDRMCEIRSNMRERVIQLPQSTFNGFMLLCFDGICTNKFAVDNNGDTAFVYGWINGQQSQWIPFRLLPSFALILIR